jgi:2-iminoacetate synthase ThiH
MKRPELAGLRLVWTVPRIVAGEADMFPAKWSNVAEQVVRHALTCGAQRLEGGLKVAGVPQDDGGHQEVEA